jgi:hypothetical protein
VACPLRAIDTASGGGNELSIALVEWCLLQEKQDVLFDPMLELANWKQDALRFVPGSAPLFAEAVGKCLFLLGWL